MAATRITEDAPTAGGPDDLDALLSYDLDEADTRAFELTAAQAPQHANINPSSSSTANNNNTGTGAAANPGLNLNEEVKIVKRREPVAKLDETRLLSGAGIPKLRHTAGAGAGAGAGARGASKTGNKTGNKTGSKERSKGVSNGLGIRGKKGEEFEDVARMLARYQLWMDDLYPRAKMADALVMVEKLGHSKRMQMLRKEWIDEGKPRERGEEVEVEVEDAEERGVSGREEGDSTANGGVMITGDDSGDDSDDDDAGLFVPMNPGTRTGSDAERQQSSTGVSDDVPMEDELDALLAEESSGSTGVAAAPAPLAQMTVAAAASRTDNVPMDDDLDALLAEEEDTRDNADTNGTAAAPAVAGSGSSTQHAEETTRNTAAPAAAPAHATSFEDDYADDMDVMRDMW